MSRPCFLVEQTNNMKEIEFLLPPALAVEETRVAQAVLDLAGPFEAYRIVRKSIDARHRKVMVQLRVQVFARGESVPPLIRVRDFNVKKTNRRIIIVGAGPAGLFAALRCLELGIQPVVLERGSDVRARRRDLAAINKEHLVNPDSNYCFGEGGAGTYSDGKLYTRSTKRGDVRSVLETLVQFGASENILSDAHPHIGTNKLPGIITAIRNSIIAAGGEVHFNTRVIDLIIRNGSINGVISHTGEQHLADAVVLATGHSARDIFDLLLRKRILIEFKPFAIGVRAEHPQEIIDSAQYHCSVRPDELPPASYSLVHQVQGLGVYSFCMCPGGIIAPCATAPGEIVTNGWSPSKRNNPFANSGIVVPVHWDHVAQFHAHGPLAGMYYQQAIERLSCEVAGGNQTAPAQRLVDFVNRKKSSDLPVNSYQPGVTPVNLQEVLPDHIASHLAEGFKAFGRKMKGYFTNEAILVAPESRTSSPVRIPRSKESLQHPEINYLYPCGEGAGYAGGIVSAAIDGEKVIDAAAAAWASEKN
jgi:uncharacterized FAD-dependent dehydrogenase